MSRTVAEELVETLAQAGVQRIYRRVADFMLMGDILTLVQ